MAVPREYKITWAGQAVSGTLGNSSLLLHDVHRLRKDPTSFEVGFSVVIVSDDQDKGNFAADVIALEELFRLQFQDLTVQLLNPSTGATLGTPLSLSHSSNTGLGTKAQIDKAGSDADTAFSRLYEVTISGGLQPPTAQSANGLQDLGYTIDTDLSGLSTLTLRGTFSAVTGTQARSQAETRILVEGATITSALGGTWERGESTVEPDRTDQIASITQVWREKIFNDSASTLDHPAIKGASLSIGRSYEGAQGDASERKLASIVASYECSVLHTQTTDLKSLWEGTIRPHVVANMQALSPGSYFAIVGDQFDPDYTGNRIRATLVALASTGGDVLELVRTETLDEQHGVIIRDVWDEEAPQDGVPTPAYVFQGPKAITFTESVTRVAIGSQPSIRPGAAAGAGGPLGIFGIGGPKNILDFSGAAAGIFGLGASSDILAFLGPEGGESSAAVARLSGGAAGGTPGQTDEIKIQTTRSVTPGVRGIYPDQFDVTSETVVRVSRLVRGVPGSAGGSGGDGGDSGPAEMSTRERR